jgi:hypothetical protein
MARNILQQVRAAIANLNPNEVRQTAEQRLNIGLLAESDASYENMVRFFCPATISHGKLRECEHALHRLDQPHPDFHIILYDNAHAARMDLTPQAGAFLFDPLRPQLTISEILERRQELGLPLARYFIPFRKPVVDEIIHSVAKENTLFSLATALPNIVPSIVSLPWAVAEFGSDTAFLTMNQIRMAFLIGAANDREVGYREQKAEIGSIIAGALGWRSLARELAGKIPMGGGLVPKAAISYAGTFVVGLSLDRLYRLGQGYTRRERKEAYEDAFSRGKAVAAMLLDRVRNRQPV